jgi:hypothetical protein
MAETVVVGGLYLRNKASCCVAANQNGSTSQS